MIAFTVFNIMVNMGVMLWKTFIKIKIGFRRFKLKYLLWKQKRA